LLLALLPIQVLHSNTGVQSAAVSVWSTQALLQTAETQRLLAYCCAGIWLLWLVLMQCAVTVLIALLRKLHLKQHSSPPKLSAAHMLGESILGYSSWTFMLGAFAAWVNPGAPGGWQWDYSCPNLLAVAYFSLAVLMLYDAYSYFLHKWMHDNKTAFRIMHRKHHEVKAMLNVMTSGYMAAAEGVFSSAIPMCVLYALGVATGNWWYTAAGGWRTLGSSLIYKGCTHTENWLCMRTEGKQTWHLDQSGKCNSSPEYVCSSQALAAAVHSQLPAVLLTYIRSRFQIFVQRTLAATHSNMPLTGATLPLPPAPAPAPISSPADSRAVEQLQPCHAGPLWSCDHLERPMGTSSAAAEPDTLAVPPDTMPLFTHGSCRPSHHPIVSGSGCCLWLCDMHLAETVVGFMRRCSDVHCLSAKESALVQLDW
jgi:sterol desaturase/sphingolipid hydroxylase (fatty acid hydroxylase superfamily)